MILRSIVILVVMAAGTAFALDHPRLPHRVLHVISPAQLEATCPRGAFACATVDWGRRTCHVYVPNAHLPGICASRPGPGLFTENKSSEVNGPSNNSLRSR